MDEPSERKIAANEALFREVNEAIERGLWPGEEEQPARFRCECAQLECSEMIELSPRAYEEVRGHPRRFILRPGHELPAVDTVVERRPDYLVVEKRGAAGQVAEASDPRG